jgi:hypothetical protein
VACAPARAPFKLRWMEFRTQEEELAFLRALVRVSQMADEILEECIERGLGLPAAVDVFLTQTARMLHARAGFVQIRGSSGPVLTRVVGLPSVDLEEAVRWDGAVRVDPERVMFVAQLTLGSLNIGAFGLLVEGRFPDGWRHVLELVRGIGEQLDSAVLAFVALTDGRGALERLDEVHDASVVRARPRIGRYELVTPLGTGGMAQVMVARTHGPEGLGRLVALKRILPHLCAEPQMVEQFLDEARIGLRLSHPNLVTIHDFGQAGGAYYIAMELVRGVDLDRLLDRQGALPPAVAVGIVAQALAGLHAAHEVRGEDGAHLGLVHRDLSPHNLMVGFDGVVKILDFGVAKARLQRTVTLPGIVKGKPLYMSPEQAMSDPLDRRSDLFAVATILYEALTGRLPFDEEDEVKTMEAICSKPPADAPELPQPLWAVLSRAFEKDPDDRWRSALEMREQLLRAQAPTGEAELSRLVGACFPERLGDFARYDRLPQGAAVLPKEAPPGMAEASTRIVRR